TLRLRYSGLLDNLASASHLLLPTHDLRRTGIVVLYFPNRIQNGSIHPLHYRNRAIAQPRLRRRSAANVLDLSLDLFDGTDRQPFALHGIEQILPPRIDGDATLRRDYVDQLSRAGQRGDFVHDHRDAVTERRHGQDRAACEEAVLPAADAVEQPTVRVRHHVGVEVSVHLGRAQHAGIDDRSKVAFAVKVI